MNRKQTTNIEVKKNNRNRVFRYICSHDMISNPDIAYELKMSLPTVTQMTKELIDKGLIEEAGILKSTGGRRAKALSVLKNVRQAVGLDITKNHISFVLTNLTGDVLKYERIFYPYSGDDGYYCEISRKLERFLDENAVARDNLLGVGIAFPGIIDLDRGIITDSHILGVKALLCESISRFFAYPCYFINDANAGAYAEGVGSDKSRRFFYLSLSNTVGGAYFNSGVLEQGTNFRCGEAGHMTLVPDGAQCYCGKKGCMDVYCSAKKLSDAAGGRLEDFFEALSAGNEDHRKLWERYISYLAAAVNNIHMILDCDVILGGYVGSHIGPYLSEIQKKVAERNTFAESGSFVGACSYKIGAAALGAALEIIEKFIEEV